MQSSKVNSSKNEARKNHTTYIKMHDVFRELVEELLYLELRIHNSGSRKIGTAIVY